MKDPLHKTKVVIRHLPPSLTHSDLLQQLDDQFSGRYNWFSFRPGKNSQKQWRYSRAYIGFKHPEDVFQFAEFFDGHVFVNEKGAQHRAIVEYAPSQRVPKQYTKRDGRDGTIYKDPDYLEFLKLIAKPAEHLPSAEVQLERKEAEQAGASKEAPIVTPLMEYVRQKRAVGSGAQIKAPSAVAKVRRRSRAASPSKPGSTNSKRGSEKRKYIQKNGSKSGSRKDKSAFIVVPRREEGISKSETVQGIEGSVSGIPLTADSGKKKFLLLKGKEPEIPHVLDDKLQQQSVSSVRNLSLSVPKQNQRRDASGRLIRSILSNSEPQQKIQILSPENGKRPPRPTSARSGSNDLVPRHEANSIISEGDVKKASDAKFTKKDLHGPEGLVEKQEKRTRNKDRPDRGVWTPLRRSDVSHASTSTSPGEMKDVQYRSRSGEISASASGHNSSSLENGSHKHFGRHGATLIMKDDGVNEGKSSKRGVAWHSAHEKQMWVQKSSSGS
ncbi:Regulator of nonsense transcripts UPF3 [Quillaja saponaria]|uniref:Regulator of nonsense transcripts UPF3 n=1 Tax=Quillaja saponaria TaxID=32244 RepID=A0AAD7PCC3_QUISA|nr:Regulator of nonsense transcripts UPF3 [Quillaja saponaria]